MYHSAKQFRDRAGTRIEKYLRLAAVCGGALVSATVLPSAASADCRQEAARGKSFIVCTFDLDRERIEMALNDASGTPYGRFQPFVAEKQTEGKTVRFAMNAGMYHRDLSPVGLYVEAGVEQKSVSTRPGPGNFHMLPNGIFYIDGNRAGVLETLRYKSAGITAQYATQSGPMLLIDGQFHQRFLEDSTSRKVRNGVGVRDDGRTVVFAISKQTVTFWEFASLFRDVLNCRNALFLDGTISSLYAPDIGRRDFLFPVGPIIAVVE